MLQLIIKNNLMIKRSFLLIALSIVSATCLAFDYKVTLLNKSFEEESYNFLIQKVIDVRLNKQKPIGALVAGFSLNKETVGNDSLDYQMNALFNNKPEMFDNKVKIIMVINQLNLRYIKGMSARGKDLKDELEFTIAIDYYKAGDKTCGLLYQQLFKYKTTAKSAKTTSKDINKTFSETIKNALKDFTKQLKTNKATVATKEFNKDSLFLFLAGKPEQILNKQNFKEGLYFSCKDLYLNKPGVLDSYSFTDSTGLGQRPLIVKAPGYLMERVYAIVRGRRIFVYTGGGNYKEAVFGDDGKLFMPSMANTSLPMLEKGSTASIGILNNLRPTPVSTTTTTTVADKGITIAATDSTAKQPIKQPDIIYKATDFYIDLETGDLVYKE
jgi:hypothetical protein